MSLKIKLSSVVRYAVWLIISGLCAIEILAQTQSGASSAMLSNEEIVAAVQKHIKTQTAKHGAFWVYDDQEGRSIKLKFVKVHEKRFGRVGPQSYFANASFLAPDGSTVRVDILLGGAEIENLEPLEVSVQERDGKERHTWSEENGLWKKQAVGNANR